MPASARRMTQLHHRPRQVVRLAQVDPGPEDQHHSNQHEVQLCYSRAAPHIAGSLNLFSERPRGVSTRKICTIGLAVYGRDFIQLGSDASRVTASIEPLASLIRLSIISSLQGSFERRCLLTTDDADLVEISSVFNHFP